MKFDKEFFVGLTVGFGAGVVVGGLFEKEKRSVKGTGKEVLRRSMMSYEKMKEGVLRAKENFEDLAAEVKSEMQDHAHADVKKEGVS